MKDEVDSWSMAMDGCLQQRHGLLMVTEAEEHKEETVWPTSSL